MTREQLKAALRQPYERQRWTQILLSWLPATELFARPELVPEAMQGIDSIHQLGRVALAGGRALAVLEVQLGSGFDLLRNRVGLRNLIARFIDQQSQHGVLAVFLSGRPEYRLTLAARESVFDDDGQLTKRETAPRRYTFVLGPGEACTTAAQRFDSLAAKSKAATLDDVIEAFSVERLNKEFFGRYKEHYQRFVAHLLAGDVPKRVFGIVKPAPDDPQADRALKPVRDFAKKLLGRLVFLHFLQKKGWLGCPSGRSDWTEGDPDFLGKLFHNTPDPELFYSTRLAPLFFEALNRSNRAGDLFAPTGTRVPYLNGGLFEDDLPAARTIDFPARLFEGLLQFFGEYNFTIDENDPEEHEVGIDPEMLGHVFENLLEDNKDKGAYYTPKAIVQYMCRQSLIHYLQAHLGAHPEIETLVHYKDPGEPSERHNWVRQNAKEIEQLLDDVKICDPAIGSGAFPIGLLQEIYWIKLALDWTLDRAETKRRIIQHSIYGVDIDAGAVEIARLRFWLALIVDEEQPSPLPNLDYKIMQGDSLLESFEGIRLDRLFRHDYAVNVVGGQGQLNLDGPGMQLTVVNQQQQEEFTELTARYFAEADPVAKVGLHRRIDSRVLTHIEESIAEQTERVEIELAQHRAEVADKKRRAKGWKPAPRTLKRIAQLEADLKLCGERGRKLKALEDKPERPYFLWHVYFQDVFERGGFDIVIANPPYVLLQEKRKAESQYQALKDAYTVAVYKVDLYHLFVERGTWLARAMGIICFITPSNFLTNNYAVTLRKFLLEKTAVAEILLFDDEVFAASVNNLLFLAQHIVPTGQFIRFARAAIADGALQLAHVESVEQQQIAKDQYLLVPPGSSGSQDLMRRLEVNGELLGLRASVSFGMQLRDRTKFKNDVIENPERIDKLGPDYRQCISGRDIKRYSVSYASRYCYFNRVAKKGGCWDETIHFAKSKLVLRQIGPYPEAAIDERGLPVLNTAFMVVPHEREDSWFLLAAVNSSTTRFFWSSRFKDDRKTFPKIKGEYLKLLPMPKATDSDRELLKQLAMRASKVAGSELAAVEDEINRIVYRLFDLSLGEIAIIEKSLSPNTYIADTKSSLLARVLPAMLESVAYISFEDVINRLAELEIEVEQDTLRHYLSDAMSAGVIHDAGRGWYSRLAVSFELDRRPLAPLARLVWKEFPLLEFACWSTAQINAYTQHMLASHTVLLYADADALPSVAERLIERGWTALLNPTPAEAERQFRPGDKTVVLRPALSKQPEGEGHAAPIEKLLVDLVAEASRLRLMDESEAQRVIANIVEAGRIQVAALLGYAQRRRVEIRYFNESTNSTSAEEVDLMDSRVSDRHTLDKAG